jgi:hypothetical protein
MNCLYIMWDALQLVRSIYRANKSVQKKEHPDDFMDDFELIRLEILAFCKNISCRPCYYCYSVRNRECSLV